ncbi:hemerythrin domain-containing protein [Actinacidiphila glaucinigra]|uniref:hemerythrin domain-containing protein n=1 Tax=Actinacidiphila glaucinigra TaxID=235986 RepID=UPI0037CC75AB
MLVPHGAIRREFSLLPELVREVAGGDLKRCELVSSHIDFLCRFLHDHHEGEDLLLWPWLRERGGAQAESIVPVMEKQHEAIDAALAQVSVRLSAWRVSGQGSDALADDLDLLRTTLLEHMDLEESQVLPLAAQCVTAAEWKRLEEHGLDKAPKKTLPIAFGMVMYEGDPEIVKAGLAQAPLPARILMSFLGPRMYAAHAKRVHGTATPPRFNTIRG